MEVLSLPAMSLGIINPLELSMRKLVSYEFDYHIPMPGLQKDFRRSKILCNTRRCGIYKNES
jgi:hypothetical protein